ncbi:OmpA family protein [Kytococcus sp. Marseille-QA3725]
MTDKWGEDDHLDARDVDGTDHYDSADGEEWYEVTRRYRRGLGGWWWLALLAIPLLLALLGSLLSGGDDESEGKSSSAASTESSSGAESGDEQAATKLSYTGGKDEVRFAASAPSEADRDALVKAVEDANEGKAVSSDVTVDEKAPIIEGAALGALTNALKAGGDGLEISGDTSKLTLSGDVADEAARKKVNSGLATVYPDAQISDEMTVGGKKGSGPSAPAEPSESPSESSAPESSKSTEPSESPEPSKSAEPSTSPSESAEPSKTPEPSESSAPAEPSKSPEPSPSSPIEDPAEGAVSSIDDLTCDNAKASMEKVNSSSPISFPSGSDALYGDSAANAGRIGSKLADCDVDVVVTGYPDAGKDNQALAEFRAEKVAQALVVAGIDNSRIEQKNESGNGRAGDRHVTIQVK